jgi:uncharacterized protein DUF6152
MIDKLRAVVLVAVFVALSAPLFAHHGAASYDTSKTVTVSGMVTEYTWANPHVFLKVDAKDDGGNTSHWVIEAWNPVTQTGRGWTKNTFKPGDEVVVDVTAAKNNQPVGRFAGRIVINGKLFKVRNE